MLAKVFFTFATVIVTPYRSLEFLAGLLGNLSRLKMDSLQGAHIIAIVPSKDYCGYILISA